MEWENIISNSNFVRDATATGLQQHCTKKKYIQFCSDVEKCQRKVCIATLIEGTCNAALTISGFIIVLFHH